MYPGVGWVLWRSTAHLPASLLFHEGYLGSDQTTLTLNFSRPAAQIIAQYYQVGGGAGLHPVLLPGGCLHIYAASTHTLQCVIQTCPQACCMSVAGTAPISPLPCIHSTAGEQSRPASAPAVPHHTYLSWEGHCVRVALACPCRESHDLLAPRPPCPQFLRLGREGYTRVMHNCSSVAAHLAKLIKQMHHFKLVRWAVHWGTALGRAT